jgi:hypothetical protein
VILRRLFSLFLAVAMGLAPLGMASMAAAASTPAPHHEAMDGHCDEQPQPDQQQKAADKSCCAAMCMGVVLPCGVAELPVYHPSRERPGSDLDRRGFLAEIATPPPKLG